MCRVRVTLWVVAALLPLAVAAPTAHASATHVSEGGAGDSYALSLASEPTAPVRIEIHPEPGQLAVTPKVLRFTAANWFVPQTVAVRAIDDGAPEGNHDADINHLVRSGDAHYDLLLADTIVVAIRDDDLREGVALLAPTSGAAIGPHRSDVELELASPRGLSAVAASVGGVQWIAESIPGAPLATTATLTWGSGPATWRDGVHELSVGVVDEKGRRFREAFELVVDATPPDVPVVLQQDSVQLHGNGLLRIDARVADAMGLARVELLVDGMPASAQSPSGATSDEVQFMVEPAVVSPGRHRFEVRAIDAAGNTASTRLDLQVEPAPDAEPAEPQAPTGDTPAGVPELPGPSTPEPDEDGPRPDDGIDVVISPPDGAPGPPANPTPGADAPTTDPAGNRTTKPSGTTPSPASSRGPPR